MKRNEKIVIVILLIFLLLPTLLGTFIARDMHGFGMRLVYLISAVGFYTLGLCIFRRRTFFYIAALSFIPSGVELVHLVMNRATTSMMFVFTCFKAEKGEFMELVTSYWFVLLIAVAVWGLYFFLVRRFVQNEYIASVRPRLATASLVVIWWAVCCLGLHFTTHPVRWLPINSEDERMSAFVGIEKTNPLNLCLATCHILAVHHDIRCQSQQVEQFRFGVSQKPDSDDLVVLVIGETSRYANWQINGYQRPTSPCLAARGEQIISFDSCYTIANLTTVSVPYLLSPATPHNPTDYYRQRSLVEAFAEAGYQTAWIADQSFGNKFLHRISGTCDFCFYQPHEQLERTYLDTVLLAPLAQFINSRQGQRNQMVVLHTLGCHFKYSSRYPDSFSRFTPDMKNLDLRQIIGSINPDNGRLSAEKGVINEVREIFVNSYDNAISYTDYVLERVIRQLEATSRPALLLYVGDHGENLLDDDRNMLMHGTFSGSVWEYHVPLFVWMSPAYRGQHPDKAAALLANRHRQISTMNIFHSLPDAESLSFPLLQPRKSIFSPSLVPDTVAWGLDANLRLIALPTSE